MSVCTYKLVKVEQLDHDLWGVFLDGPGVPVNLQLLKDQCLVPCGTEGLQLLLSDRALCQEGDPGIGI